MEYILTALFIFLSILTIFFYRFFTGSFFENLYKRIFAFNNMEKIFLVLRDSEEKAFYKINHEQISIYHSSGYKVEREVLIQKMLKEYLDLVMAYCGPSIFEDLERIYGSTDAVVLNLSSTFMHKFIEVESRVFGDSEYDEIPEGSAQN